MSVHKKVKKREIYIQVHTMYIHAIDNVHVCKYSSLILSEIPALLCTVTGHHHPSSCYPSLSRPYCIEEVNYNVQLEDCWYASPSQQLFKFFTCYLCPNLKGGKP
jgi:hypothetical protein